MSVTYHSGTDFLRSYSGILKISEAALNVGLIIFTTLLAPSFQAQFLCGLCIYGLASCLVLLIFHIRGSLQHSEFPWIWIEFFNCGILAALMGASSAFLVAELTKGYIVTGMIGFVAVLLYALDAVEKYNLAKIPRSRYVWTTPNMPEL